MPSLRGNNVALAKQRPQLEGTALSLMRENNVAPGKQRPQLKRTALSRREIDATICGLLAHIHIVMFGIISGTRL